MAVKPSTPFSAGFQKGVWRTNRSEMSISATSVFADPDDYLAALRGHGEVEFLAVHPSDFRARLARISLPHMSLSAGDEASARIAWVKTPARQVRISLPAPGGASLISGGVTAPADKMTTHGPGAGFHEWSAGPCRWRTIGFLEQELLRYGRALVGDGFRIPQGIGRWRPPATALRRLTRLHTSAIRSVTARPYLVAAVDALHGLEQDLIGELVSCMGTAPVEPRPLAGPRQVQVMAGLEDLLHGSIQRMPSISEVCAALAVSQSALEKACRAHLGMGPRRYIALRRLQNARRALRAADPETTRVCTVAGQFGFRDAGGFAASYRARFGETPTTTLRRTLSA